MSNVDTGAKASDAEEIARRFGQLPSLLTGDADLARRGRFLDCHFIVGVGDIDLLVEVRSGTVASVARGPFLLKSSAFAIRATAEAWSRFLQPVPPPGFHDLMALSKAGLARIDGNLQPFMANLQYVKDVLAAARMQSRDVEAST